MRVKHYIKNILVFIPMFFGGVIIDPHKIFHGVMGFIAFCALSSSIYIINDIKDIEHDKVHPTKCNRPLASGMISVTSSYILIIICLIVTVTLSVTIGNFYGALCLLLYFILNIGYSFGLKEYPIIDIVILASGFVIRVFYGGFITDVNVSQWLYLVITTGSLYMGLGKRLGELKHSSCSSRKVLKYYNASFLEKNMYVCVALADVFYALWTLEMPNQYIRWTIPFFIIILMCYSLDIEGNTDGDPVEVILKNKLLIFLIFAYAVCITLLLYLH